MTFVLALAELGRIYYKIALVADNSQYFLMGIYQHRHQKTHQNLHLFFLSTTSLKIILSSFRGGTYYRYLRLLRLRPFLRLAACAFLIFLRAAAICLRVAIIQLIQRPHSN